MWRRIFTALPLADSATKFLLSVGGSPISRHFFASTMRTIDSARYHGTFQLSTGFFLFTLSLHSLFNHCPTGSVSNREFGERVNRLASHLRAGSLHKDDRVAFFCPNTSPLLEAHFAVPTAGGILVTLNSRLNSQEIDYILKHSGASFLFVDAEPSPVVEPLPLEGIQVVRIDDTGAPEDPYEVFLTEGLPEPVTSWLEDEEEPIAINYTSGTTGQPKGVV